MGCLWKFVACVVGIPILILGLGTWLLPIAYNVAIPSVLGGCIENGLIPSSLSYPMSFHISLALLIINAPALLITGIVGAFPANTEN